MALRSGILRRIAVNGQIIIGAVIDGHGHPGLQVLRFVVRPGYIVIVPGEDHLNARIEIVQFFTCLERQCQRHVLSMVPSAARAPES